MNFHFAIGRSLNDLKEIEDEATLVMADLINRLVVEIEDDTVLVKPVGVNDENDSNNYVEEKKTAAGDTINKDKFLLLKAIKWKLTQ